MYKTFKDIVKTVKTGNKKKVIVAAADDLHTLEAVFKAADEGTISYILIGDKSGIEEKAKMLGHVPKEDSIEDVSDYTEAAFRAVELIRQGKGDFLMKGSLETGTLLKEVVNKETGIGNGGVMSHMALLEIPSYKKLVGLTDSGMVIYPTLEQKKEILKSGIEMFHKMGIAEPKVACLAAVEKVNEKMPETVEAAELKEMGKNGAFGKCIIEGPISFDLTFSNEIAEIKKFDSTVTGDVDIIMVPDMPSGNIMGKTLTCLAGTKMAGCILGAKAPIVLTSRGSSLEEKYNSLMLCAAQV